MMAGLFTDSSPKPEKNSLLPGLPLSTPFSFSRPKPVMPPNRNAQCTHLTMTRLYTKEYRCSHCYRISTMNWIYRCTQDRELLIEDDVERGEVDKMDALCDLFPEPARPRTRGPVARMDPCSFLDEMRDDAMKTYTPAQIALIIRQRAHVNYLANEESRPKPVEEYYYSYSSPNSPNSSPRPLSQATASSKSSANYPEKLWLAPRGKECQFKCCAMCRPSLIERASLSIDGIVNNDIPATAIYGFGFHLDARQRPVALVKHVKNLGLRPSSPPKPGDVLIDPIQSRFLYLSSQMAHEEQSADIGLGLGLDTTSSNRIAPPTSPLTQLTQDLRSFPLQSLTLAAPEVSSVSVTPASCLHQTFSSHNRSPARAILQRKLDAAGSRVAILTPLPDQTDEELEMIAKPLTPMEREELGGAFGEMPLDVGNGVAVTEEAVGGHFADIITQV